MGVGLGVWRPAHLRPSERPVSLESCPSAVADAVLWVSLSLHLMITPLVTGVVWCSKEQARRKEWSSDCGVGLGGCRWSKRAREAFFGRRLELFDFGGHEIGWTVRLCGVSTTRGIRGKEGAARVWKASVDVAGGKEGWRGQRRWWAYYSGILHWHSLRGVLPLAGLGLMCFWKIDAGSLCRAHAGPTLHVPRFKPP